MKPEELKIVERVVGALTLFGMITTACRGVGGLGNVPTPEAPIATPNHSQETQVAEILTAQPDYVATATAEKPKLPTEMTGVVLISDINSAEMQETRATDVLKSNLAEIATTYGQEAADNALNFEARGTFPGDNRIGHAGLFIVFEGQDKLTGEQTTFMRAGLKADHSAGYLGTGDKEVTYKVKWEQRADNKWVGVVEAENGDQDSIEITDNKWSGWKPFGQEWIRNQQEFSGGHFANFIQKEVEPTVTVTSTNEGSEATVVVTPGSTEAPTAVATEAPTEATAENSNVVTYKDASGNEVKAEITTHSYTNKDGETVEVPEISNNDVRAYAKYLADKSHWYPEGTTFDSVIYKDFVNNKDLKEFLKKFDEVVGPNNLLGQKRAGMWISQFPFHNQGHFMMLTTSEWDGGTLVVGRADDGSYFATFFNGEPNADFSNSLMNIPDNVAYLNELAGQN